MPAGDRAVRAGAAGLLVALVLAGCGPSHGPSSEAAGGFRLVTAGFNPAPPGKAVHITKVTGGAGGRVFVQYELRDASLGRRFRISTDGGATFGPERELSLITRPNSEAVVYPAFTAPGLAAVFARRKTSSIRAPATKERCGLHRYRSTMSWARPHRRSVAFTQTTGCSACGPTGGAEFPWCIFRHPPTVGEPGHEIGRSNTISAKATRWIPGWLLEGADA